MSGAGRPRRTRVDHNKIAAKCKFQPGIWLPVSTHGTYPRNTVREIETGQRVAYAPAGSFEVQVTPTELEFTLYVRFMGQ